MILDESVKALISYRLERARNYTANKPTMETRVSVNEAEAQLQSAREFIEEIETAIEKKSRGK